MTSSHTPSPFRAWTARVRVEPMGRADEVSGLYDLIDMRPREAVAREVAAVHQTLGLWDTDEHVDALAGFDHHAPQWLEGPRVEKDAWISDRARRNWRQAAIAAMDISRRNARESPLLALPTEIRDRVFAGVAASSSCLDLMRACRQTYCEVLGEIVPFGLAGLEAPLSSRWTPALDQPRKRHQLEVLTIHVDPTCDPYNCWLRFEAKWLRSHEQRGGAWGADGHFYADNLAPKTRARREASKTTAKRERAPVGRMWRSVRFFPEDPPERNLEDAELDPYFIKTSTWAIPNMDSPLGLPLLSQYCFNIINVVFHAPPRNRDTHMLAAFATLWTKMYDVVRLLSELSQGSTPDSEFRRALNLVQVRLEDTTPADDPHNYAPFWLQKPNIKPAPDSEVGRHKILRRRILGQLQPEIIERSFEWDDRNSYAYFYEIILVPFLELRHISPRALFTLDWPGTNRLHSLRLASSIDDELMIIDPGNQIWPEPDELFERERDVFKTFYFLRVLGENMTGDRSVRWSWQFKPIHTPSTGHFDQDLTSSARPFYSWLNDLLLRVEQLHADKGLRALLKALQMSPATRRLAEHLRDVFASEPGRSAFNSDIKGGYLVPQSKILREWAQGLEKHYRGKRASRRPGMHLVKGMSRHFLSSKVVDMKDKKFEPLSQKALDDGW